MPTIKPFNALIPAAHLQHKVVTRPLDNYTKGEAKRIAANNDCSFLHLINPELDNLYLRATRQELIFKKINENFDAFIEQQLLVKQEPPAIYVYRTSRDGLTQTGIWTITAITDYLEGNVKKHELTVERYERLLADYLEQTSLDANPILITYPTDPIIDAITEKYINQASLVDFVYLDQSRHQLWAIHETPDVDALIQAFKEINTVYIADGHHRIASMAKLGKQTYYTTVYMNTDEIKVLSFNRLVKDLGGITSLDFLNSIRDSFVIVPEKQAVNPTVLHEIGMYINHQWYRLEAKKKVYDENDPVAILDVSILQNVILSPLLSIHNPRTDSRISFQGGRITAVELEKKVDSGLFSIAFTLFPVSVQQLLAVADAGGIMPPKSTWIEPKFLVGLVTNRFS